MKKMLLSLLFFTMTFCYSQMGIQTSAPRQVLHIDGEKDTPISGATTLSQESDDFVVTSSGFVGVGVINPAKPLDVEANSQSIRFQNLTQLTQFTNSNGSELLFRNSTTGDISAMTMLYPMSQSINAEANFDFVIPPSLNFSKGLINIFAINTCGRTMMAQFSFSGNSLFFIGGMGRDVIGQGSILNQGNIINAEESVVWRVLFPSVVACADGGDANQFNFDIQKVGTSTFRLTSKSNVTKIFNLSAEKL